MVEVLVELRKVSSSAAVMQSAHDFLIKRAYDQRLGYTNLLEREKYFKALINPTPIEKKILEAYQNIIEDKLLMYSLDRDINFFNMGIIDHVVNGTDVIFAFYYKSVVAPATRKIMETPFFNIIRNGEVEMIIDEEKGNIKFNFSERPCVLIPASHIVFETFYDCNISQNAFNIQILEKSERELFRLIKEKRVQEIILNPSSIKSQETLSYPMCDKHGELNIASIKSLKYVMGTKQYSNGRATLSGNKSYLFSPDPYSDENREK